MAPFRVPSLPARELALLVGIVASAEVPAPVALLCPESAVLDVTVNSADCGNAHLGPSEPECVRRGSLGGHTAVLAIGQGAEGRLMSVRVRLVPTLHVPLLSS